MAAFSLFWDANMSAVTLCENTLQYGVKAEYETVEIGLQIDIHEARLICKYFINESFVVSFDSMVSVFCYSFFVLQKVTECGIGEIRVRIDTSACHGL